MTDLLVDEQPKACRPTETRCQIETFPAREAELGGGLKIRRALPNRTKRMVGAWCFLDHFGPLDFGQRKAMDVGPHPHIGLQTVTWLLQGEALHKDDLGYEQVIFPGQLNIMTAGRGITHSEETPLEHTGRLHGLQLWVALPDADRHSDPAFDHHPHVPTLERDGLKIQVFIGEAFGEQSPARIFSPMVGMDFAIAEAGTHTIPLRTDFEHALVVAEGEITGDGETMSIGSLYDLGLGRDGIRFTTNGPARFVIVGGAPFGEEILMWWNFVARTHDEIAKAREDWQAGRHFGAVTAYEGARLPAPELKTTLR